MGQNLQDGGAVEAGWGGGWQRVGGGEGYRGLAGGPKRGGGLRATHYYHMHVCVRGHGGIEVCMR